MTLISPSITTISEVKIWPDVEKRFAKARAVAADRARGKQLVIVTTKRAYMLVGCPGPETFPPQAIATVEKVVPSGKPLNIAVIASNDTDAIQSDVLKVIPFAGYLLTLVHLGHYVTVFEGHKSALVAGVRDADLLLVDGSLVSALPPNWLSIVKAVMRQRWILQFSPDGKWIELAKPEK